MLSTSVTNFGYWRKAIRATDFIIRSADVLQSLDTSGKMRLEPITKDQVPIKHLGMQIEVEHESRNDPSAFGVYTRRNSTRSIHTLRHFAIVSKTIHADMLLFSM